MSAIPLYLPPDAKVIGALRDRSNPWSLDQDMLSIELPGTIFITVGWHPDLDPTGEYRVEVFRESPDNLREPRFLSRDVARVQAKIYDLVRKYHLGISTSGSGETAIALTFNGHASQPLDSVDSSSESITSEVNTSV